MVAGGYNPGVGSALSKALPNRLLRLTSEGRSYQPTAYLHYIPEYPEREEPLQREAPPHRRAMRYNKSHPTPLCTGEVLRCAMYPAAGGKPSQRHSHTPRRASLNRDILFIPSLCTERGIAFERGYPLSYTQRHNWRETNAGSLSLEERLPDDSLSYIRHHN